MSRRISVYLRCLVLVWQALMGAAAHGEEATPDEDIASCNLSTGNPVLSIPACTRLLANTTKNVNQFAIYNNRGNAWLAQGMYDNAIADFTESIQRDPTKGIVFYNRGRAWHGKDIYDRAIEDYNAAVRLEPANANYYFHRGLSLSAKDEDGLAVADFDKAVTLDPKHVYAYLERARSREALDQRDAARRDAEHAEQLAPRDPVVFMSNATVWVAAGDLDRALAAYNRAAELSPKDWRIYAYRANIRRLKGDFEQGLEDVSKALEITPDANDIYLNRGLIMQSRGDLDLALEDFNHVILAEATNVQAYASRAFVWRSKGSFDRALADINRALALVPKGVWFLTWRGEIYTDSGDYDRALADFNQVLRINGNEVAALAGRGHVYELRRDFGRAKIDYEKALALPETSEYELSRDAKKLAREWLAKLPSLAQSIAPPDVRVALVIGNSQYSRGGSLSNPRNDAAAIAQSLSQSGFKTVVTAYDATREQFLKALQTFQGEANKADWALVYYAGHGIEMNGVNYLIPVDARLASDRDVANEAITLNKVMATLGHAKKLRMIMLDACRDNPFVAHMTRSLSARTRGLAPVEPDSGTLVVYAAKHGEFVEDEGDEDSADHSPFAAAFLKRIEEPGLEIRKIVGLVTDDVVRATDNRQRPFSYGSLSGREDFYLRPKVQSE